VGGPLNRGVDGRSLLHCGKTPLNIGSIKPAPVDETLPIINKPKQPKKKGGNTRNKMEGSTSKKTREPSKRVNHKGNIKFLNPLLSQETYQIRKPHL
jgi:hypothetical protein